MATLSVAARDAALTAVIALLETGGTQARPSFLSFDTLGAALHNTFLAQTAPPLATFDVPSGGVASKAVLPWSMTFNLGSILGRTLATWQINSQLATSTITGTFGALGSGADIELPDAVLTVLRGNSLRLLTFALAMA